MQRISCLNNYCSIYSLTLYICMSCTYGKASRFWLERKNSLTIAKTVSTTFGSCALRIWSTF